METKKLMAVSTPWKYSETVLVIRDRSDRDRARMAVAARAARGRRGSR